MTKRRFKHLAPAMGCKAFGSGWIRQLGRILKEWEYKTTPSLTLRMCSSEQHSGLDMEKQAGFQLEKKFKHQEVYLVTSLLRCCRYIT